MYENFVGTWETVHNREVSVLERCPHGEVRLYYVWVKNFDHFRTGRGKYEGCPIL